MTVLSHAILLSISLLTPADPERVTSFAEPGISPDGREIAVVSGGDIWTVPTAGGEARLLVSHPATESRPLYSPDGSHIAFTSTRTGNGDVYVLDIRGGDLTRLTYDDANELVSGWSADGQYVYLSSSSRDLAAAMNDVFRVAVSGGTPMVIAGDRYSNEYFAAPSPDGRAIAITARGFAGLQWWRLGHSHLDESEIWIVREGQPPAYQPVTPRGAKQAWPMWSRDGRTLYYMSDRDGAQNIWKQPIGGEAAVVTSFRSGHVLWPSLSRDGGTIAFEREFQIWTLDTTTGQSHAVPIQRRGAPAGASSDHVDVSEKLEELALSPDGKKIAVIAHGDVFSAPAKEGGDAQRVTRTPGRESQVTWAPDSRRVAYVSTRDRASNLYLYDFTTGAEAALTTGEGVIASPRFSPDGKLIVVQRNARELHVIDVATRSDRLVAKGAFDTPPFVDPDAIDWSPDSKFIVVLLGWRAHVPERPRRRGCGR